MNDGTLSSPSNWKGCSLFEEIMPFPPFLPQSPKISVSDLPEKQQNQQPISLLEHTRPKWVYL
jgi:hypothetical protein